MYALRLYSTCCLWLRAALCRLCLVSGPPRATAAEGLGQATKPLAHRRHASAFRPRSSTTLRPWPDSITGSAMGDSRVIRRDQAGAVAEDYGVHAVAQAELVEQAADVRLDCCLGEE